MVLLATGRGRVADCPTCRAGVVRSFAMRVARANRTGHVDAAGRLPDLLLPWKVEQAKGLGELRRTSSQNPVGSSRSRAQARQQYARRKRTSSARRPGPHAAGLSPLETKLMVGIADCIKQDERSCPNGDLEILLGREPMRMRPFLAWS